MGEVKVKNLNLNLFSIGNWAFLSVIPAYAGIHLEMTIDQ